MSKNIFINAKHNNMKIFKTFLVTIVSLFFFSATTQAQFFKKVAKTAKQVAKSTFSDDDESQKNPPTGQAAANKSATNSKSVLKSSLPDIDFEKHQISVLISGTASFNSGEFFMEKYSSIQAKDDKIISTVVVAVMTEEERLSELGEGSGKDVAFIYENGKK